MRSLTASPECGGSGWPFGSLLREYTRFVKRCTETVFAATADAPTAIIVAHAAIDTGARLGRLMVRSPLRYGRSRTGPRDQQRTLGHKWTKPRGDQPPFTRAE
jgi:hypothetical protein